MFTGSTTPPTGPAGGGAVDVVVTGDVIAGPPGSVTVPVESAVKVNVIMVRVESREAPGNCFQAPD